MSSSIVFPFDFTPPCEGAPQYATAIAEHEDADLHCIHANEEFLAYYEAFEGPRKVRAAAERMAIRSAA